jgi:hypothetical protein
VAVLVAVSEFVLLDVLDGVAPIEIVLVAVAEELMLALEVVDAALEPVPEAEGAAVFVDDTLPLADAVAVPVPL